MYNNPNHPQCTHERFEDIKILLVINSLTAPTFLRNTSINKYGFMIIWNSMSFDKNFPRKARIEKKMVNKLCLIGKFLDFLSKKNLILIITKVWLML